MRDIPTALQASLDSGASTLARCWRLDRRDGVTLGFTDHDANLTFDAVIFEAASGLTASAAEAVTGLASDTHEITGALSSASISERDIARGLYDGAEVTLFLVNWRDVAERVVLSRGSVGEIRRGDSAFEAEIVGLSDRLNQPFGRAFVHSCNARLGDARCGVNLSLAANSATGLISGVSDPQQFTVSGLSGYDDGWFAGGLLRWTSGANSGLEAQVKAQLSAGTETLVELWLSPPEGVIPGDAFEIFAGCDKTYETCAAKFGNGLSFRGFPHMPGDDLATSYPNSGGAHDGGSLFRS